ncbi:zinc ribbon domain-containing protein [Terrilactibacillus sp. S3-3]|nr:zinc ribbon domain-containing protein [Terrilactibacillus sp. S3-3]
MLQYKCDGYGKQLIIVNPHKTSQICSHCGYDNGKHALDIRDWICPECSIHHDRDINAAKNILNLGLEQALVNSCGLCSRLKCRE